MKVEVIALESNIRQAKKKNKRKKGHIYVESGLKEVKNISRKTKKETI